MKLGEKIRHLRHTEGKLRGGRMSQSDMVRAAKAELGETISQSYLSQIESGERPHLTNQTRQLLAKFFKVHPSFLVDDPEGYQQELLSNLPVAGSSLSGWLREGGRRFRQDSEVSEILDRLAERDDVRPHVLLLGALMEAPDLLPRLLDVLLPAKASGR